MAGSRNKKTYHFGAGHVGPTPALITFPPQLVVFWRDVPFALSWCGQVVAVVVEIVVGGDGWPMKGVVDIHTYLYGSSVRSGPNRGSASADFCLNREQNRTELSVRSDRFRFSGSVRNRTSATLSGSDEGFMVPKGYESYLPVAAEIIKSFITSPPQCLILDINLHRSHASTCPR
jgi:hypothetical protein